MRLVPEAVVVGSFYYRAPPAKVAAYLNHVLFRDRVYLHFSPP